MQKMKRAQWGELALIYDFKLRFINKRKFTLVIEKRLIN